jgi:hypothetical protein
MITYINYMFKPKRGGGRKKKLAYLSHVPKVTTTFPFADPHPTPLPNLILKIYT